MIVSLKNVLKNFFLSYKNKTNYIIIFYYLTLEILIKKTKIRKKMNTAEFRVRGKEMIDFIADYLENIE